MSEFDSRAREWDNNPVHWERSEAIAKAFLTSVPVTSEMKAMEYGAGTGILSFLLSDRFAGITLMDNSNEMVQVMHEKVKAAKFKHFNPLFFDLEHHDFHEGKFDCIYSQMVMHHVNDVNTILRKFYGLLNPGGYLAVADLFTEDGSFHGPDAKVHKGFDPDELSNTLKSIGFETAKYETCYAVKRPDGREYPIFLLVARK
jgi:Methylase involved in ubiquinone/menaquinone biosynthesis